tara:strand:+ start:1228 stop:1395 length:168 start_codon:yes stop_codon:yes gene_type:complete
MSDYTVEDVFNFLDMLRESGVTNMYGAAPYIREEFNVGPDVSRRLLTKWMDTFNG